MSNINPKSLENSNQIIYYFDGVIQGNSYSKKATIAITDQNGKLLTKYFVHDVYEWQIETEALAFLKLIEFLIERSINQNNKKKLFILMSDSETLIKAFSKGKMNGKSKAPELFNKAMNLIEINDLQIKIRYVESKKNLADKYTR
ncbi:MAG: hypothetical protein GQ557_00840 [Mycoplasmataceae bacterium]|nr:hypothetical protein [Mycoplasmataceae bacterium]